MNKKNYHHQFYLPWYAGDEHADSWISYLHRNLHHLEGENHPFTASEWHFDQEDAYLHDEVHDLLYKTDEVDASYISVIVINRHVTLYGNVDSMEEKISAERIVTEIPEVWSVTNELVIREDNGGYRF